jgi:hypothetical protein
VKSPQDAAGDSFIGLFAVRALRSAVYTIVGMVRPGWRRAKLVLRMLERYSDRSTFAIAVYSDPRFEANVRALESELRRLRRGGAPATFQLPHDFPPGAQSSVSVDG